MAFASLITQAPRAFDASRGAEALARLPALDPALRDLIQGTAGSSPYLAGLIGQEAEWLEQLFARMPDQALADILDAMRALEPRALSDGLRMAKRRVALLAALADLGGAWSLAEVTGALTEFADIAVDLAIAAALEAEAARRKIPLETPQQAGLFALAMGKMGAHELNYSSDIDLIVLFEASRHSPDAVHDIRAMLIRATRRMAAMLSDHNAAGYVLRTDLRLRPDAAVTPVCVSMEAAEAYYESVGRTWERAAYVKARPAAGDVTLGQRFLHDLRPFIWRKHLDFAAIQDAHDMRLRIRAHKGLHGPITLPGHNMKLGRGGIREIEFFTQTRQIIAGGRDPSLRVRGTLAGLERLVAAGWVPSDDARTLSEAYIAHRTVEHRLQMIGDAQTHSLPNDADGFARLACLMGTSVDTMKAGLGATLTAVHALTEGFFAPRPAPAHPGPPAASPFGADLQAVLDRWGNYPALRSARAVSLFERLKPDILARLEKADRPAEALEQFDAFLKGLPAGVQVFSLFQANPQLIDLIVDIAATAPALAHYLGRNAQVFDAVIGGDFFAPWPGRAALTQDLTHVVAEAGDYETQLDAARRWQKEWHFRVGVHYLRGLMDADRAGQAYADLAEAVLAALWPAVCTSFAEKHGLAPGRGAAVLGMGSLGAARLTATSDLDLIVIYDAPADAVSDGRRPLASRTYFARLTQAFVTALAAPMAEGLLYNVDMRLRPSGRSGPVATSWSGFQHYQRHDAWTWEHLALTRARPVAGNKALFAEIEAFRGAIMDLPRSPEAIKADIRDMRARLAAAKPSRAVLDVKNGPGGMQDIELLAQSAALLAGERARDTAAQMQAGAAIGWFRSADVARLLEIYGLYWPVQSATRLVLPEIGADSRLGAGGQRFLLHQVGVETFDELQQRLHSWAQEADALITRHLGGGIDEP
ncbi:MAG: glutamine-synthetase adenylyltransferase [Pseudomonadota bacterium]